MIKSKGYKLKDGKFRLDIREIFFIVKVVRHWDRLPRAAVNGLTLTVFKARMGWIFEQLGLGEGVPVHSMGAGST